MKPRHSTSLKKRIGFRAGLPPRLASYTSLHGLPIGVLLASLQTTPVAGQLPCGSPTPSPKRTMPRATFPVAWARPAAAWKIAERGLKPPRAQGKAAP